MSSLTIRIRGHDLPGLWCRPASDAGQGQRGPVHVGIQRGREVIDLVPGDASEAVFELAVNVVATPDGGTDFRGPYVQGKRGERFLYLSWGELAEDGVFAMFRRAKLHLSTIDPADLERAIEAGAVVEGHLPLTDRRGQPLCASVRPPLLRWSLASD